MLISEVFLTLYLWVIFVLSLFITFIVCMILYPFVDQKTFSRTYESIMAYILIYSMTLPGFWKLKIIDNRQYKSWKDKQYVIVANHLSFIDSLLLAYAIPLKKKFMIGEIFTKIPFFGWLSRMLGHVTANRNNPDLNKTAVERAVQTIQLDNSSFAIYPEGRRELKPYLLEPFKTGAYRIALKTELQVLPVTLKGTYEALRFWAIAGFSTITIFIDEPFYVVDDDHPFYINLTKKIIKSNLKID